MKSVATIGKKNASSLSQDYASALDSYLQHQNESALHQAYEFGRQAMSKGTSLVELVLVHQEAFLDSIRRKTSRTRLDHLGHLANEFLSEALSPYEMANRGFQEAVSDLRRMNELLEQEIKRIAYAVHDEAGQLLTAVHLALSNLEHQSPAQLKSDFENVNALLKQVESQLRQYSHELRPTILDDLGLVPAVQYLANAVSSRSALPVRVSSSIKGRLSASIEIALYRVLQEALNNVVKHAHASTVSIDIQQQASLLVCKVQDDGVGFDPALAQKAGRRHGLGLVSMKERVNSIGGTLEFDSSSGRGTCLLLRVPISNEVKHARTHSSRG
jgi:signal transduction histidine kinase